jgi:hypothetical protein
MATISKGIKLSYIDGVDGTPIELTNLQEIPELGGDVEAIEITTLADAAHMYTDGILNYGDSLAFKFLYEQEQFTMLNALKNREEADKKLDSWKVELPDGTTCTFGGSASVKLDGVGVNAALTYTLSIKPNSAMTWA